MCWRDGEKSVPALHKVGEEDSHGSNLGMRHNLTQYVCCKHFGEIVGPGAAHMWACGHNHIVVARPDSEHEEPR